MISRQTVENIAKLARLQLSEADLSKYTDQLSKILDYVERLKALDTDAVEATTHATLVATPLREDKIEKHSVLEAVLEIAPDREEQFFRVPKVL